MRWLQEPKEHTMKNRTPKNQKPADATASPGLSQTKAIRLEVKGVKARAVCLAGSFNDWKPEATPLKSLAPGRWVADLALLPGRHEYLLVVDGRWQPDPSCPRQAPNPFGGVNSVLEL